jgi:hypothetical protein
VSNNQNRTTWLPTTVAGQGGYSEYDIQPYINRQIKQKTNYALEQLDIVFGRFSIELLKDRVSSAYFYWYER